MHARHCSHLLCASQPFHPSVSSGFLGAADQSQDPDMTVAANFGFWDMLLALQWVGAPC